MSYLHIKTVTYKNCESVEPYMNGIKHVIQTHICKTKFHYCLKHDKLYNK